MPDVTAGYVWLSDFNCVFYGIFIYYYMFETFIKLSQIVCLVIRHNYSMPFYHRLKCMKNKSYHQFIYSPKNSPVYGYKMHTNTKCISSFCHRFSISSSNNNNFSFYVNKVSISWHFGYFSFISNCDVYLSLSSRKRISKRHPWQISKPKYFINKFIVLSAIRQSHQLKKD